MSETVDIRYLRKPTSSDGGVMYSAQTRKQITESITVPLNDARLHNKSLVENGFQMVSGFQSSVHDKLHHIENPPVYRVDDGAETEESRKARLIYSQECERLVKELTGADVAFCITHAVRNANTNKAGKSAVASTEDSRRKSVEYLTAYATFAHVDFTTHAVDNSWKMLVKRGVPENEAKSMRRALFNVWQPIGRPVEMAPLAMLDWASVEKEDVHEVSLGYSVTPKAERTATYSPPIGQVSYNPKHEWYYYPSLKPSEAIVFTQADTRDGRATHAFHTAVRHQMKPDPRPRESVEVRILCGFKENTPAAHL